MIESGTKVKAQNLPNLFARYEGSVVTATSTEGASGKTQMFKTMDSAVLFLTPEQTTS